MNISTIGSGIINNQSSLSGILHQRWQDFKAMESAVQNGNLPAAQSVLAALGQDTNNIQKAGGVPATLDIKNSTTFQSDLNAMINAIQSGNISNAQYSLSALHKDMHNASASGAGPGLADNSIFGFFSGGAKLSGSQGLSNVSAQSNANANSGINAAAQAAYAEIMKLQDSSSLNLQA